MLIPFDFNLTSSPLRHWICSHLLNPCWFLNPRPTLAFALLTPFKRPGDCNHSVRLP